MAQFLKMASVAPASELWWKKITKGFSGTTRVPLLAGEDERPSLENVQVKLVCVCGGGSV